MNNHTTNTCLSGNTLPQSHDNALHGFMALLARTDYQRLFIITAVVVNVGAVVYALSKIMAAYAIGGIVYAVVTGGMAVYFMLFFAAFAVVMVKRYDGWAIFATVMTLLSALII